MVGQLDAVTEFSAYNNGGSSANAYAYKGTNDGSNHYTVSIPVADDTAIAVAKGTARVVSIGQVVEHKLSATASTDPRPEVEPTVLVNTLVQHASQELALTGTLQPRRVIVATEKCNVCHGALGATSGSNTLANAFHSGARNTVESCVTCHDANRMSSTIMTNGMALNESYQFKRMIHGIHGSARRASPFTHGNTVVDVFNMDGTSATGGLSLWQQTDSAGKTIAVENFAAEVAYPDATLNCSACHVNGSYKTDLGTLGSVVKKPIDPVTGVATTDPNAWLVISPKAATCTSCHDGKTASGLSVINHVIQFGGATFGDKSQRDVALLPRETCDDCHTNGGAKNVDIVHGQK
jgi:OmcA/MtrC family decaheme c-type cytochrome